jgi:hypothetical protein
MFVFWRAHEPQDILTRTMANTDPDMLVDLTNAASPFEAEIIRAKLQDAGIEAFAFTAAGWSDPWGFGSTQPYRVQVRRKDSDAAAVVLRDSEPRSNSVDWDAEDLGEPPADEPAATAPSNPQWAEKHEHKRTLGQTIIWLALVPAFGLFGFIALIIGVIARARSADQRQNR